jgi:hypothetical protein
VHVCRTGSASASPSSGQNKFESTSSVCSYCANKDGRIDPDIKKTFRTVHWLVLKERPAPYEP